MAVNKFQIFNQSMNNSNTFSDSEYTADIQRKDGVRPGVALVGLHNKLYRQASIMPYALGEFMGGLGYDAPDSGDGKVLANNLTAALVKNAKINPMRRWMPSKAYVVGDIVESPNMPSWARAVCVAAGNSSAAEPRWGTSTSAVISDGAILKWSLRRLTDSETITGLPPSAFAPAGYGLGGAATFVGATGDLNTIKAGGMYYYTNTQGNRPSDYGTLYVNGGTGSNYYSQIAISLTNDVFTRIYNGSAWTLWQKMFVAKSMSGIIFPFAGTSAPEGSLICDGREVSRTTYAGLFASIGTAWGEGNKSTTFNIPDLRGEFLRGADIGRGVDSDRIVGSKQGDAIRNITGRFSGGRTMTSPTGAFYYEWTGYGSDSGPDSHYVTAFDASKVVPTANENRPRNAAVTYCIWA